MPIRYFTAIHPADLPGREEIALSLRAFEERRGFGGPVRNETGVPGLKLDFCQGLRLSVPAGDFRVKIYENDTKTLCYDEPTADVTLVSLEKYYVPWAVEVYRSEKLVFSHVFEPTGRQVFFCFVGEALGDALAFLPYVKAFGEKYRCRVAMRLPPSLRELAARLYPDIPQVTEQSDSAYAVYYPGMWYNKLGIPCEVRSYPLDIMAGVIVGIKKRPPRPVFRPTRPPWLKGPYVAIGVQASAVRKGWLCPGGWDEVVEYLRQQGLTVYCIDRQPRQEEMGYVSQIPAGAVDMTGDISLLERANMLRYAEFFIGLGSGLAWLAHSAGCPVILISGMSQPWCEFYTPYRVINQRVCHGCFNDVRVDFRYSLCPYHEGTERELECSRKISPGMVIQAVEELRRDLGRF